MAANLTLQTSDPTTSMIIFLAFCLITLIVTNTALRRQNNKNYRWIYAVAKIVAYLGMFAVSITTLSATVAVSMLSTYLGMELQTLLLYMRELGIFLGGLFNSNGNGNGHANGNSKQTQ